MSDEILSKLSFKKSSCFWVIFVEWRPMKKPLSSTNWAFLNFSLYLFNFFLFKHLPEQSNIKNFIINNEIEKKVLIIKKDFNNIYFDRIYKNNLAKYSSSDCFVLGSSQHVTLDINLKVFYNCKKLTNLSLQGATMEDYLITIYFIMSYIYLPWPL